MKDIDRLEAVLQAKYYDKNSLTQESLFSEFYDYASRHTNQEEKIISEIFSKLSSWLGAVVKIAFDCVHYLNIIAVFMGNKVADWDGAGVRYIISVFVQQ